MNRILVIAILCFSQSLLAQKYSGAIKVEVVENNGEFSLHRDGKPYYVKGVGGKDYLDRAKAYGANSIRTWSPDNAEEVLDYAHENGMTVLLGLWVGQERQGFDYDDGKGVKAQLLAFTEVVKKYKDHPALLMWGIGNENDLFYSDFKVWNAINDIAKMIHELDPNHPTMTVTAGIDVAEVQLLKERAPHIDILGINTYGDLLYVSQQVRSFGWEGAYMITEWGPTGHWEVPKAPWGASIEQSSTEKAASYKKRWEEGIYNDRGKCIGSYVFLWGYKQETTATWYGVFLPEGKETAVMDEIQHNWSGEWPSNRAPKLEKHELDGKDKYVSSGIYLNPGSKYTSVATVTDLDNDELEYVWQIIPESTDIRTGGDAEEAPEPINIQVVEQSAGSLTFKAPKKKGAYRLFLYAFDGNGNAATNNIPFYVDDVN